MAPLETDLRHAFERRLWAVPARPDLRARISDAVVEGRSGPQPWRVVAASAALLLVAAVTFYFLLARHIQPAPAVLPTSSVQSPTPATSAIAAPTPSAQASPSTTPQASSSLGGPAAVVRIDTTPPPGYSGDYALQFQLKLVQSVDPRDTFRVAFHPPNSARGYEATFTLCPPQSDNGFTGPTGPCRAGATYVEGGGLQPKGSSISYVFTRTSASGTTQVIAQGVTKLNMDEALLVVYPPSS